MLTSMDLFARHLDLAPLKGRRHGLVRCIFHPTTGRTPSLSVDLDKGVFFCHGCGQSGGLRRFAELVGEPWGRPAPIYLAPVDEEAAWRRLALLGAAWALQGAQNRRALPGLVHDTIREDLRWVDRVRAEATQDDDATWERLAAAAAVEVDAWALELELGSGGSK